MKKLSNYINRSASILTGKENLESLYTLKDFPVFMGCVETPVEEDIIADMDWGICPETGIIQLLKLIPVDVLYLNQHNDGVGEVWKNLYLAFVGFLDKYDAGKNILEIGGAHAQVAENYTLLHNDVNWTIIEPNPQYIKNPRIRVISSWFDENFTFRESVDSVVHSHLFEHIFNPRLFLEHISGFLPAGAKHIFAFPNMLPMLERKFTNCLNFEHTLFLTEDIAEHLLSATGFKITGKDYYGNPHSIFYATEKTGPLSDAPKFENKYNKYKKIFMDFIDYHQKIVNELNEKVRQATAPIYLFGAHIFSQYLIGFGLQTDKIVSILDNSSLKQGKRLYGTRFLVESPKVLKDKGKANIILKAGIYNEEIKKDILENINNQVEFW